MTDVGGVFKDKLKVDLGLFCEEEAAGSETGAKINLNPEKTGLVFSFEAEAQLRTSPFCSFHGAAAANPFLHPPPPPSATWAPVGSSSGARAPAPIPPPL